MVWANLATDENGQALEALEKLAGVNPLNFWITELRVNAFNDPILDQPEFVEVRSRLGFRE